MSWPAGLPLGSVDLGSAVVTQNGAPLTMRVTIDVLLAPSSGAKTLVYRPTGTPLVGVTTIFHADDDEATHTIPLPLCDSPDVGYGNGMDIVLDPEHEFTHVYRATIDYLSPDGKTTYSRFRTIKVFALTSEAPSGPIDNFVIIPADSNHFGIPVAVPDIWSEQVAEAVAAAGSADVAEAAAVAAGASATSAASSASAAAGSASTAGAAATSASASAGSASTSAQAASMHAASTTADAASALASATSAASSAAAAEAAKNTAVSSGSAAVGAASSAQASALDAEASATSASGSKNQASSSATAAETARSQAVAARQGAEAAQTAASDDAADAAASATEARNAELGALAAQGASEAAQAAALASAGVATTKAGEASTSAADADADRIAAQTALDGAVAAQVAAEAARAAIPLMPVQATNLRTNPLPASITGYGPANGATVVYDAAKAGIRVTVPDTGSAVDSGSALLTSSGILPGVTYTVSVEVEAVTACNVTVSAQGTAMGGTAQVSAPTVSLSAGEIRRLTITYTTNAAGASNVYLIRRGVITSQEFIFRKVLWVVGTFAPDYFDGSNPGARWTGTANASASELLIPRPADRVAPNSLPVIRRNRARNPRGISTGYLGEFTPRFSWINTFLTSRTDGPDAATTSWVRATPPANPAQGTARGVNLYGNEQGGAPGTTGTWRDQPVTPGDKITVSGWMRTNAYTAGMTFLISLRFHDGAGNWVGAAVSGPNATPTAANQWLWVTATVNVPAGGLFLSGGRYVGGYSAWTDTNWIDVGPLVIEGGADSDVYRSSDYFDGSYPGARWTGAAHNSASELQQVRTSEVASLARSATRYREGIGSPENFEIAPPGTTYVDLNGTNGAWEWRKRTGTGATGWVVIDGDTGWRNITDPNGGGGVLRMRRVGSTIELALQNISGIPVGSTAAAIVYTLPTGWRFPNGKYDYYATRFQSSTTVAYVTLRNSNELGVASTVAYVASWGGIIYTLTYTTTDPWPTSLPGSAA